MSKPYDATTKYLLESHPATLLAFLGLGEGHTVRALNVDLSTVTAEVDGVLLVEDDAPWLTHVEFQTGYETGLGLRLLRYNVLLNYDRKLPVQSVVLLLRPEADGPAMTGLVEQRLPDGGRYLEFRYRVERAWRKPVQAILDGPLGLLPLAPIADVPPESLPDVIRRMVERLRAETTFEIASTSWTSTYVLMGLRYPDEMIQELLQGVRGMRESVTYQAILREGRAEGEAKGMAEGMTQGERRILIQMGRKKFGPPDAETIRAIETITDLGRIERMADRLLDVTGWNDLLSTP